MTLERLVILILTRQLGKSYTGLCNYLEIKSYKGFYYLVILNIQINSPTYSIFVFKILFEAPFGRVNKRK